MQRRKVLRTLAGLTGAGLVTGLYAWQVEPFWLEFVRRKMPVDNLPKGLKGKILMQISDIHVGNRFDYQFIIDSFWEAQALEPDIVVYTGDYVSYEDDTQIDQLATVMQHAVLGKLGTAAILGNHDYGKAWSEPAVADAIIAELTSAGIEVLRNESTEIAGLNVIGFDDAWGTNFAPASALKNYDPTAANVLLCHNPDVCDQDVWQNYRGWILSGHTHGGQCKPPFLPPPVLPIKNTDYAAGEVDLKDGRMLYVNRALGHLHQVRFNVRPEITLFELC